MVRAQSLRLSRRANRRSRSSSEQVELLRKAESRQIIQKVADDTASLRTRSNYAASRADSSSLTNRQSQMGDTVFDFDDTVVSSFAYRRALQHSFRDPDHPAPMHDSYLSKHTDEGYASGVTATPDLSLSSESPIQQLGGFSLPQRPHDSVFPGHSRSNSAAFNPNSLQPRKNSVQRAQSDSSSGSKREAFRSVFRRLSASSRANTTSVSPRNSTAARRERQQRKSFSTSIDLTSNEGAAAPHIVKIAQSGALVDVERLIKCGHDIETRHLHSGRNALLVAAHCGNVEIVDLLIQKNARLNVVDGMGYTALHLAASRGHCLVVELLVAEKLDIEARNKFGNTALWVAAYNGQLAATQLLIANHAKVNTRSNSQTTALHVAAKRGDDQLVELLVNNGADVEARDGSMMTALHYACEEGHSHVAELLLNKKANIEAPGRDRRTPLICAAATGKFLTVQHLLKRKSSCQAADDASMTALHWAAFNGHVEIVDLLSKKKSLLFMANAAGRTPLHLAVMGNQFAVVELLARRNVPLETRCRSGLTALHYACIASNLEIIRLLLMTGSDIEAQIELDGDQRRPIHIAAASGSTSSINLLIDKGASLESRDAMRDRALCVACRYGHVAAVQKLLERGSPFNMGFETGLHEDSPLCLAAMGGHSAVVSLLVQHGASIQQRDEVGWQPVHYAAYYGHLGALQLLLAMMPSEGNTDLAVLRVGYAPGISEKRRREVRHLLDQSKMGSISPRPPPFGTPTREFMDREPQIPLQFPSFEHTTRHEPAPMNSPQELPGTLEQGLPSSRSATPERMHRYPKANPVNAGSQANQDLSMDLNEAIQLRNETSLPQPASNSHLGRAQHWTESGSRLGTISESASNRTHIVEPQPLVLAWMSTVNPEATDTVANTHLFSQASVSEVDPSDSESLTSVHTASEGWPVPEMIYEMPA